MLRNSPNAICSTTRVTSPFSSHWLAPLLLGFSLMSVPVWGQEASESPTGSTPQETQAGDGTASPDDVPASPEAETQAPPKGTETIKDAETLKDADRLAEAFQATQKDPSVESLNRVIETCESVLSSDPQSDDRAYATQLAVWALTQRSGLDDVSHESAIQSLDRAIELDPKAWKAYLARAWHLGSESKFDQAISDLDLAIDLEPKSTKAWFNRAELHYQLENYVLAVRDYTRVIVMDPRDAQAYTGRGHAYFQLTKYQEAMGDYQKVVLLTEGAPAALLHRAEVCQTVGLWEKARDDYQLAAARDQKSGLPQIRLAWLYATCPDSSIADPDLAVQLAERGVKLRGPDDWSAANTLATACATAGDYERSTTILADWETRLTGNELKLLEATREVVAQLSEGKEKK